MMEEGGLASPKDEAPYWLFKIKQSTLKPYPHKNGLRGLYYLHICEYIHIYEIIKEKEDIKLRGDRDIRGSEGKKKKHEHDLILF